MDAYDPPPPVISDYERWFYDIFEELVYDRPQIAGATAAISLPIKWETLKAYADHLKLDEFEADRMIKLVRSIDRADLAMTRR